MSNKVPQPIFTLRGHHAGVTALTYCSVLNNPYLVSGDEEGSLCVWDLAVFRKLVTYPKLAKSRVQSLKTFELDVRDEVRSLIFIHSRNNGVLILDLSKSIESKHETKPVILETYDSFESLFSRGDAILGSDGFAVLAYPSCLENYLVTIRVLGKDAQTLISGTADRKSESRNCTLFDIALKEESHQRYLLFAAYEDGCLCTFSFSPNSTRTVPHLNCTGLDVQLVKKFDLKIGDFISAYDLALGPDHRLFAAIGSPLKQVIFVEASLNQNSDVQELVNVPLKRQGISAISIRPDKKLIAVAGWDSTVRLYSAKSYKLLAILRHHLKQVQCILFYEEHNLQSLHADDDHHEASGNVERKYLMCCASMEGTISISSIY